jgi:hypothetical protein
MLSQPQFQSGQPYQQSPDSPPPLSLGKNTTGSAAQATAWSNRSLGGGKPLAYSSKTRGTTYSWDDTPQTNLPESDKGAGRNG